MNYIEQVKKIWDLIYHPDTDIVSIIEKYFHEAYEQCINGVMMNRARYIEHVLEQRKNMTVNTIDYQNIMEKNNEVFAIYYPRGVNLKKEPVEAEVIAYFRFEAEKLFKIHGQVRLLSGDLSDVDM